MQTLEGLKRRIKTTSSLKDIVSSMKTLSAVSVGQYEKSTHALEQYSDNVELALQALLKGKSIPKANPIKLKEKVIAIILGSDQGLVGRFNKTVANYAFNYFKEHDIKKEDITLLVAGRSLSSKVLSAGWEINTLFTMPSSVKIMLPVAKNIVLKLSEIQTEHQKGDSDFSFSNSTLKVYIFHNQKGEHSIVSQNVIPLVPINIDYLKKLQARKWETKNIPIYSASRRKLFSSFIRQLLFVDIYKAISQSLSAEHFTRMVNMQNAQKNIEEHLEQMHLEYQQRRQTEITNELLDVVSGAEVLNSKKNKTSENVTSQ